MNKDSFEQMDRELEERFRPLKEVRIPQEIFKNFDVQVRRKIMEQEHRLLPLGVWYAAVAVSLVTIAAIGILVWRMNIKAPEPIAQPVKAVLGESQRQSVPSDNSKLLRPARPAENESVQGTAADHDAGAALSDSNLGNGLPDSEMPALKDSDLVTEIEALQELGAWTEEDDDSIGISLEHSLAELELGLETENMPLQSNPQLLR